MRKLLAAIKLDLYHQVRSGILGIYVIITILYIVLIGFLPESIRSYAAFYIIFTDPSVLGFFFIGGIIMLEKQQGVIDYQVITPLSPKMIILSKVISLALVSCISGTAIVIASKTQVNYLIFLICIILTSSFFTLVGAWVAVRCDSINQYFVKVIPMMFVVILPCFAMIKFPYYQLFRIFPSFMAIDAMYTGFFGDFSWWTLLELGGLLVYILLMWSLVEKAFASHVVFKEK
ncbi:MAG: hypothetical protein PF505_08770 [Vallitaleaceae bacterium]|jgi:fluoroquinolone transport system permease protein|nr:hypothetical protein [Vallitaleaceae bacterium]